MLLLTLGHECPGVSELLGCVTGLLQKLLHSLGILGVNQYDAVRQLGKVVADCLCRAAVLAENHHVVFDHKHTPLAVAKKCPVRLPHWQVVVLSVHLRDKIRPDSSVVYQFDRNDNRDLAQGSTLSYAKGQGITRS